MPQNVGNAVLTAIMPTILMPGMKSPWSIPTIRIAPLASDTSLSVAASGVATVTQGTWNFVDSNNPIKSTAYQWYHAGTSAVAITGATSSSYTLVSADETYHIYCAVKTTNWKGQSAAANSNSIGPVTA